MKPNWFVALPVTSEWLDEVIHDLPASCRSFAPSDLHITVAFLGAVDEELALGLIPQIEALVAQPYQVGFDRVLTLPSAKRCSALSLSLREGNEQTARLMGAWRDDLLGAVGAKPDLREPLPHITVARPIRKYREQGREAAVNWAATKVLPQVSLGIKGLALYTWAEDRKLQQFRIVHRTDWSS